MHSVQVANWQIFLVEVSYFPHPIPHMACVVLMDFSLSLSPVGGVEWMVSHYVTASADGGM